MNEPSAFRAARFGPRFFAVAAILAALVAWGVSGYMQQRLHGDIVTGLRTIGQGGPAWGLYIVFDIFFVGLACGGIAFVAFVRLFRLNELRSLSRMAQLMSLVSLAMSGLCVVADLGRPLHGLMNFPRYARTMSPFFGTFSLVACTGSLATFVYLWLDGRADAAACASERGPWAWFHRLWAFGWQGSASERWRHRQTSFWLSLALLPLLVIAYSTLGFVFGIQGGRPGWFSPLQAPGLLVLAGISSMSMLLVIAAIARRTMGFEEEIKEQVFFWLGNVLWVLGLVYVYILVVEQLTANYAGFEADARVARAVTSGHYATSFWLMAAGIAVPTIVFFGQLLRRSAWIPLSVTCALVLNVATVVKRVLIVVPSQTNGMLLPYPEGKYNPTWVEFAVMTGLLSLGTLLYMTFTRVFPIVPLVTPHDERLEPADREASGRRMLRLVLFWCMFAVGVALALFGFALCARIGNDPWQDPPVPLSPVIFVVGMVLVFYSAALYEVLPSRASDARSRH